MDGGKEKKRGDGGKGELVKLVVEPCSNGKALAVCNNLKYVEETRVIFSPRHWPSSTSPRRVSSAVYLRAWHELQKKMGRNLSHMVAL